MVVAILISLWMELTPSVHSRAHRSLGKWSCHLRARHDAQILADVNVTLHVMKIGKKCRRIRWPRNLAGKNTSHNGNIGANNDAVSVCELADLCLVSFRNRFELCVVI